MSTRTNQHGRATSFPPHPLSLSLFLSRSLPRSPAASHPVARYHCLFRPRARIFADTFRVAFMLVLFTMARKMCFLSLSLFFPFGHSASNTARVIAIHSAKIDYKY